jgi:hypothetical protein
MTVPYDICSTKGGLQQNSDLSELSEDSALSQQD